VNDEEFARSVFTHAFESGMAAEPGALPSIDRIEARSRRARRNRQGVYAAGTVALAGAVTAGVVSGPSMLGLGSGSGTISPGTGTSGSSSPSGPKAVDGKAATPCPTSAGAPTWSALIQPYLPAGMTMTASSRESAASGVSCVVTGDGTMLRESVFTLANPSGVLQVDVTTGSDALAKASPLAAGSGLSQAQLRKVEAAKSQLAASKSQFAASKSQQPDAAGSAPAGAAASKMAAANSARSKEDGAPNAAASGNASLPKVAPTPACSDLNGDPGEQLCTMDATKGGYFAAVVDLARSSPIPIRVEVTASTATPVGTASGNAASGTAHPTPPLDAAQLTKIALAIANQY
jgi:hypothetical protein